MFFDGRPGVAIFAHGVAVLGQLAKLALAVSTCIKNNELIFVVL